MPAPKESENRIPRTNALPDEMVFEDTGCDLYAACLECPLPMCRYDHPGGVQAMRRTKRDADMRRMRASGMPPDVIARHFGVSRRTVFRVTGGRA